MQYTKYLRWVLLGGLSLVFFIPFIIADGSLLPNMFFPFITGKNFAFRIVVEVLLAAYVLLALREPKYRPRASLLLWTALAFVGWMAVATVLSADVAKSFWSNFERMEGYVTVLHLFAYFVIVGAVATAEGWWNRLFQVSIGASAIMGLYGVLQLLNVFAISTQSGSRVDATFGNAAYLAVYMLFAVFLTLFMLVRQRNATWVQVLYGIALVLQVITLYQTQTRGAVLGLLGGLIVAGIYIALRATDAKWRTLRKISLWGLGVIAIVVVAFFALRNTPVVQSSDTLRRLASISLEDKTTQSRFQIWSMAQSGFMERPVVGWGQENFSYVFNKYYQPAMYSQEQWFDRAHNQFLDWLIAGGLPAFLLYLGLFCLAVFAIVRSSALSVPEQAMLLGLLAGYAFNNLLVFGDLISSVYFFLILAFVHGISKQPLPGWLFLSKPVSDKTIAVVAPIVAVVFIVGAWSINGPGIARAKNILAGVTTQVAVQDGKGGVTAAPKDPKINLADFKVAAGEGVWPGTGLGKQEVMEQLLQFASNVGRSSTDPTLRKETLEFAVQTGEAVLAERKDDARLELFMGSLYNAYGDYENGLKYLQAAMAHSPQKQQIMFETAVAHLNLKDTAAALPILKQAFEEAPSYNDARILYAIGMFYAGDKAGGDALLTEGFGTVFVDDTRLLQIYTNLKQYDRVVGVWKTRVAANPEDSKTHVGLATAYFAAGDKANTIAELKRAAALDPNIAAQVAQLILQIQNGTLQPGQ